MDEATSRSTGKVKWFNDYKGFGFISPDDGGDDLFVHHTSIRSPHGGYRTLSDGHPVEFLLDYAQDGRTKAVDVTSLIRHTRPPYGRGRGGGYGGRFAGPDPHRYSRRGGAYGGGGGRYSDGVECYNCGRVGHLARDCYHATRGGNRGRGGGGGGRGRGGGGVCFHCGEEGHFARECPNVDK